jgi:hypothetical protein
MSLGKCLKEECSGDYYTMLKYVTQSRAMFLSGQVTSAIKGLGCDKSILNEVFCLSSGKDLQEMRAETEGRKDFQLTDRLRKELSGNHEKLILHLLTSNRVLNTPADHARAAQQAEEINRIIKKGGGFISGLKDEAEWAVAEILAGCSVPQCDAIEAAWDKARYGSSLAKTIADKMSGAMEEAVLLLLQDPIDAYCAKIKKAVGGIGCDEEVLARILG